MAFPYLIRFLSSRRDATCSFACHWDSELKTALRPPVFMLKLAYIWIAYLIPNAEIANQINQLALIAMAITALGFGIVLLPHKLYITLIDYAHLISRYRTLTDLLYLQKYIHRICPSVSEEIPSRLERLYNLEFHTYRAIIQILDGRKLLVGYLNPPPSVSHNKKQSSLYPSTACHSPGQLISGGASTAYTATGRRSGA